MDFQTQPGPVRRGLEPKEAVGNPHTPGRILVGRSIAELAAHLIGLSRSAGCRDLIHVAASARRAERLGLALQGLAPTLDTLVVPAWDCMPYDRAPPSRDVMGRRIAALSRLAARPHGPRVVIASPAALLQRVPPWSCLAEARITLATGAGLSLDSLEVELERAGYVIDERVDEPGEAALRGQVVDLFPAGAAVPVRVEHEDGRITAIRSYDPVSQLTTAELESVTLLPASELVLPVGREVPPRFAGIEHWLSDHYASLDTWFDTCPEAAIVMEPQADDRVRVVLDQTGEAYESRIRLRSERAVGPRPPAPNRLYLDAGEWDARLRRRSVIVLGERPADEAAAFSLPPLSTRDRPLRALAGFVREELACGRRVVVTAATERDLRKLTEALQKSLARAPERVSDWSAALASPSGSLLGLVAELDEGFIDPEQDVAVVTAPDVLGSRAETGAVIESRPVALPMAEMQFRIDDTVVHLDHGMGVLRGMEAVTAAGGTADMIRLDYAGGATLIVPAEDMDRVWRYGASAETVSLDRLDGGAWEKRRAAVAAEIAETARELVRMAKAREARSAPKLTAPRPAYERFVARFPFSETPDQMRAIDDVRQDLASGRPMDRLVCGDVGFGKTEVALRAAAIAALAGKQVAVVAPTTVLACQHLQTFRRRFADLGIEIGHLSRLAKPAEARAVKAGLADGSIRIVVGTHAIAGKGVRFQDLGLVIIDEEQRFGSAHKQKLRRMGQGLHVLTLTATPIPRTLQAAMVGLQEISTIATPPARRQPIRTFLTSFDAATVREALLRERRRGGQSFVVCPRVGDLDPMAARLSQLVPELDVVMAHGKMPAGEIDDAMVRFADGEGDALLATNIIESGLDVPRANTMLVWHADRFGLSQLHQLRGRVGRGRVRGVVYLLTDPQTALSEPTRRRLETLETLDRLGAGFEISARDLDMRGAGDLLGEEQAGHVKLVGVGLHQHLLQRALAEALGEAVAEEWTPELNLGPKGSIPESYVPEPEVRINLHARLATLDPDGDVDLLRQEIEDRFGPMPELVRRLIDLARLRQHCRRLGVARIDAGPQAIALTFRPGAPKPPGLDEAPQASGEALAWRGERLIDATPGRDDEERLHAAAALLERLE